MCSPDFSSCALLKFYIQGAFARLTAIGNTKHLHVWLVFTDEIRSAVNDCAKEFECDMIVVGARGRGLMKELLLGSLSQYLVHHSPVPTCVLRAHEETPQEFHNDDVPDVAQLATDASKRPTIKEIKYFYKISLSPEASLLY